ncbi:MAG: molybdopterin-guanine dinucleotide biosynthesis protein B [Burkholderiales bacterium]|nr:molybdopterin-guanine dinucleotide biosynthesis protein B [Burkholderiales bacterium]
MSQPAIPPTSSTAAQSAVLGVVGSSGSGKTTLLEYLVTELCAQGLRINAIKHSHHDLMLEPLHKDSARLRLAGAGEVLVCSPYRYAIIHELRQAPEPGLAQQLARMAPADLTLVEGFKFDPIPKLEVYRPALGKDALFWHDPHIVAVASDVAAPQNLPDGLAWLDLNATAAILHWLLQQLPSWQRHRHLRRA